MLTTVTASEKETVFRRRRKTGLIHHFHELPLTSWQNQLTWGRLASEFYKFYPDSSMALDIRPRGWNVVLKFNWSYSVLSILSSLPGRKSCSSFALYEFALVHNVTLWIQLLSYMLMFAIAFTYKFIHIS